MDFLSKDSSNPLTPEYQAKRTLKVLLVAMVFVSLVLYTKKSGLFFEIFIRKIFVISAIGIAIHLIEPWVSKLAGLKISKNQDTSAVRLVDENKFKANKETNRLWIILGVSVLFAIIIPCFVVYIITECLALGSGFHPLSMTDFLWLVFFIIFISVPIIVSLMNKILIGQIMKDVTRASCVFWGSIVIIWFVEFIAAKYIDSQPLSKVVVEILDRFAEVFMIAGLIATIKFYIR